MRSSNGNELWFSPQLDGRNARYCLSGAKLASQPLTEAPLHAKHPSHIWEIIWMPLALVARKFADDWVKPRVNSANWNGSGGIPPCTPNRRSLSSKFVSCQGCCIAGNRVTSKHHFWVTSKHHDFGSLPNTLEGHFQTHV